MQNRFRRLCALALACLALTACNPGDGSNATGTGDDPTTTPAPVDPSTTPAPDTAPAPIDTTTGNTAETTAPTPETTKPAQPIVASGKFSSETGSNLEIHIDWSVIEQTDKAVTLRAEAYITCYTIWVSARNGGVLKIGNSSQSFSTEAIVYEGKGKQTYPLASSTVDIPLSADGTATVDISVSWPFLGSYSGIKIDRLTCGGTVTVGHAQIPETTAPVTTASPVTTAPAETTAAPVAEPTPILAQGDPILYKSSLYVDRDLRHWGSVTLVQSAEELARMCATHPADCTNSTCAAIMTALKTYDEAYFAEKALLLVPQGNLYPTAAPVEIFDIRSDSIALYVHVRDIAASRKTEVLSATRFYLQIAEIPASALGGRIINIVQHGAYYTDAGKYESDYLHAEGKESSPAIRTYQPAAITP